MLRFGHVYFAEGLERGALKQQSVMQDMRFLGIIEIDDDALNRYFQEDRKLKHGTAHSYALHNIHEIRAFRKLMKSEKYRHDDMIRWKITKYQDSYKDEEEAEEWEWLSKELERENAKNKVPEGEQER